MCDDDGRRVDGMLDRLVMRHPHRQPDEAATVDDQHGRDRIRAALLGALPAAIDAAEALTDHRCPHNGAVAVR
jgi:hypothetical protein